MDDGGAANTHGDPAVGRFDLRRWNVIDALGRRHGARTLVQIVTPTTSLDMAGRPELSWFSWVTTLTYASPMQRSEIPRAARLPTLDELTRTITTRRLRADIVFVDPWHTYLDSRRVLVLALMIVNPGGHVVVHDCDPPTAGHATALPAQSYSYWSGETWRAYVDVSAELPPGWSHLTIDDDYGIGVVAAPSAPQARHRLPSVRTAVTRRRLLRRVAISAVRHVPSDLDADSAWRWLQARRAAVLQLRTPAEWIDAMTRPAETKE